MPDEVKKRSCDRAHGHRVGQNGWSRMNDFRKSTVILLLTVYMHTLRHHTVAYPVNTLPTKLDVSLKSMYIDKLSTLYPNSCRGTHNAISLLKSKCRQILGVNP